MPEGVQVGTVDRFQGREAPDVFYANRLNVAVSRVQCIAVLVANPRPMDANCRTLDAMALVDGACRFAEMAQVLHPGLCAALSAAR